MFGFDSEFGNCYYDGYWHERWHSPTKKERRDLDDFLEKGQSRIISMALIHENLYQTDQLDNVNFQKYIENLVHNIKNTFNNQNDNILTQVKAVDANFDIQTSIPLGLIINELYCNILKHAFPEQKQGKIVGIGKELLLPIVEIAFP